MDRYVRLVIVGIIALQVGIGVSSIRNAQRWKRLVVDAIATSERAITAAQAAIKERDRAMFLARQCAEAQR